MNSKHIRIRLLVEGKRLLQASVYTKFLVMRSELLSSILACTIAGASAQWGQIGGSLFGSYFGLPLTNATFDYIIVGGGLAGLTVANRLAENKSLSIAVVEPGSFYEISNGNLSQIPLYSEQYVSKDPSDVQPLIDWELLTTPQPVCLAAAMRMNIWLIVHTAIGQSNHSLCPGTMLGWVVGQKPDDLSPVSCGRKIAVDKADFSQRHSRIL